jgi:hypothetical protein
MKLFLICSKYCYGEIKPIADELINNFNHEVIYPNSYDNPNLEFEYTSDPITHRSWKATMFIHSAEQIQECDAVLVLNLDLPIRQEGYIGGATMLEMYEAFRQDKKIFVYNELPDCSYKDELNGLTTLVIYQDLNKITKFI